MEYSGCYQPPSTHSSMPYKANYHRIKQTTIGCVTVTRYHSHTWQLPSCWLHVAANLCPHAHVPFSPHIDLLLSVASELLSNIHTHYGWLRIIHATSFHRKKLRFMFCFVVSN